jgi:hypothetical protein
MLDQQGSEVYVLEKLWDVSLSLHVVLDRVYILKLLLRLQRKPVVDTKELQLLYDSEEGLLVVVVRLLDQ